MTNLLMAMEIVILCALAAGLLTFISKINKNENNKRLRYSPNNHFDTPASTGELSAAGKSELAVPTFIRKRIKSKVRKSTKSRSK